MLQVYYGAFQTLPRLQGPSTGPTIAKWKLLNERGALKEIIYSKSLRPLRLRRKRLSDAVAATAVTGLG